MKKNHTRWSRRRNQRSDGQLNSHALSTQHGIWQRAKTLEAVKAALIARRLRTS